MAQSGCAGLPGILSVKSMGKQRKLGAMVAGPCIGVTFQPVVHSMRTREADCVEAIKHFGEIEWTSIRMPDLRLSVERR